MILRPKLFTLLTNRPSEFNKKQLIKEFFSGITVAFIAVPLSIALAISSGVTPEKGLVTAVMAGFFVSLLGGSRVQIAGPTGAFVVIVLGIVNRYGIDGLIASTMLAGFFLILMGLFKFGRFIKYIPYPIVTGFTGGIAVVLFSTQINDFFGLGLKNIPGDFIDKWSLYAVNLKNFDWQTVFIGVFALLIISLWPKRFKFFPPALAAIVITTLASIWGHFDVETVGLRFGNFAKTFPSPHIPNLNHKIFLDLLAPSMTIAILAAIESLMSAVVADGMIGKKHRSNMELIAQGVGNIASSIFGGIPSTGAIARTAANISGGSRLPIAGIIHALGVLAIMILFSKQMGLIPMATLAAILFSVAYKMSEWRSFVNLFKAPKDDIAVLLVTFGLTVFADLVVAIKVGMILASVLFMKRMADVYNVTELSEDENDRESRETSLFSRLRKGVSVYEINGPFFFGAANSFLDSMEKISDCRVLVLKMANVPAMDATGYHALYKIHKRCLSNKIKLLLVNVQRQPHSVMESNGFVEILGKNSFSRDLKSALEKAEKIISESAK